MAALSDDLEWLRERAEVEKSTMYSDLGESSTIITWSEEKW
jgi:hypothetical protein